MTTPEEPAVTLYRPTGPEELALIRESGWRAWPPRLPEQPIFYPVLNEEYATKIARDWKVPHSGAGYVTRFQVRKAFLDNYQIHQVGGQSILEYWVPAEDLPELNASIIGTIVVIATYTTPAGSHEHSKRPAAGAAGAHPRAEQRGEMMRPDEHLGALVAAEAAGEQTEFLFFWGHQPQRDGTTGPGCLSQWWPAPFTVDSVAYPTAEHWMMAGKARLFGDDQALAAVLTAEDPRAAKAAGRTVRGFAEQAWAAARFDLVVDGNRAKFTQHPELAVFLAGTRPRVLVEASPRDRIWAIGMTAGHPDATRPSRWRGTNLLGFALMNVRDQL